jgi:(p)ppGpp synthase/HD superfamily hydrolase
MYQKAKAFMEKAHEGQYRKDYGFPYKIHINRVCSYLDCVLNELGITGQDYDDVMSAGALHDCIEDTNTTFDDLRKAGFNENVISYVNGLTNTPAIKKGPNRAARHEINKKRLASSHKYVKIIKLCDIYDNISDLIVSMVRGQITEGYYLKYLEEKLDVLPHIWVECQLARQLKGMLEDALRPYQPKNVFTDKQLGCIPLTPDYQPGTNLCGATEIYGRPMENDHLG